VTGVVAGLAALVVLASAVRLTGSGTASGTIGRTRNPSTTVRG
jgi:hypothetical protein